MAEGIRKLHSTGCPKKQDKSKRCRCNAGYEATVFDPRKPRKDGGFGDKVRKTFKNEKPAKTWRREAKRQIDQGVHETQAKDSRPLGEALGDFVDKMKSGVIRPKRKPRYKPNTIRSYDRAVRKHIAPRPIAQLPVNRIQREHFQHLVSELQDAGLSMRSISNTFNPIQAFYRRGVREGDLPTNPTEGLDLAPGNDKRPKRVVRREEAAELLALLEPEDRPVWATAIYAGLRRGELQALRVCDIDLGKSVIRVERGWDQEEGVIDPKTYSSRRRVPLLAPLRDYLDEHLLRTGRSGEDLVFGRSPVDAFYPSTIDNRAKKAWEAHNRKIREAADGRKEVTPISMHEGRHTLVSMLIDSGANAKAIQVAIGHTNIKTTYDTYGHMLPGAEEELRDRMNSYLAHAAEETRQAA